VGAAFGKNMCRASLPNRQDGVTGEIMGLRICGDVCAGARANRLDLAATDYDGLIVLGRGARAINHTYMKSATRPDSMRTN